MPVRSNGGGRLRSRDIVCERGPNGRVRWGEKDTGGADGGGEATNIRGRRGGAVRGLDRGGALGCADVDGLVGCLFNDDRRGFPRVVGCERMSARGQFPSGGGVRGWSCDRCGG